MQFVAMLPIGATLCSVPTLRRQERASQHSQQADETSEKGRDQERRTTLGNRWHEHPFPCLSRWPAPGRASIAITLDLNAHAIQEADDAIAVAMEKRRGS
jgi:hypothetical protein